MQQIFTRIFCFVTYKSFISDSKVFVCVRRLNYVANAKTWRKIKAIKTNKYKYFSSLVCNALYYTHTYTSFGVQKILILLLCNVELLTIYSRIFYYAILPWEQLRRKRNPKLDQDFCFAAL